MCSRALPDKGRGVVILNKTEKQMNNSMQYIVSAVKFSIISIHRKLWLVKLMDNYVNPTFNTSVYRTPLFTS